MEKEVAKRASEDRRAWLDGQDANCAFPGCGRPKRAHNPFYPAYLRVTDHMFVAREESNE